MGAQYGSGLPASIGNANVNDLLEAFGQQILDRVDLARGRVRPNFPSTWRQARNLSQGIEERRAADFRWRT